MGASAGLDKGEVTDRGINGIMVIMEHGPPLIEESISPASWGHTVDGGAFAVHSEVYARYHPPRGAAMAQAWSGVRGWVGDMWRKTWSGCGAPGVSAAVRPRRAVARAGRIRACPAIHMLTRQGRGGAVSLAAHRGAHGEGRGSADRLRIDADVDARVDRMRSASRRDSRG